MSIFEDFGAIRKEQQEWRKSAVQTFVPGIDPADLKTGQKVTISPNLMIHDRSYTDVIHEIVAVNSSHVQTKIPDWGGGKTRLVMLLVHEHHFYDASGFASESEVVGSDVMVRDEQ